MMQSISPPKARLAMHTRSLRFTVFGCALLTCALVHAQPPPATPAPTPPAVPTPAETPAAHPQAEPLLPPAPPASMAPPAQTESVSTQPSAGAGNKYQGPTEAAASPEEPLAGWSNGTLFLRSADNQFLLFPNGRLQID